MNLLYNKLTDRAQQAQAGKENDAVLGVLLALKVASAVYGGDIRATDTASADHVDTPARPDAATTPVGGGQDGAGAGQANILKDWHTTTEFYLDERGRLLALRTQTRLPGTAAGLIPDRSSAGRQLVSWLRLRHTDSLKFTLQATPANSVDVTRQILGGHAATTRGRRRIRSQPNRYRAKLKRLGGNPGQCNGGRALNRSGFGLNGQQAT